MITACCPNHRLPCDRLRANGDLRESRLNAPPCGRGALRVLGMDSGLGVKVPYRS